MSCRSSRLPLSLPWMPTGTKASTLSQSGFDSQDNLLFVIVTESAAYSPASTDSKSSIKRQADLLMLRLP